jgi:hypothetical protein
MPYDDLFTRAQAHARAFLATLPNRPVNAATADPATPDPAALSGPVPPLDVLDALAAVIDRASVATPGPRYFGFVTGGSLPVAVAADWLVSVWDQNAGLHVLSPAMARIEDVTAAWLLDLFGLPAGASVGFVTGATMANVTGLAAARHEVLRRAGWDVEADGLQGAPKLNVVVGSGAHASIDTSARFLGFGTSNLVRVAADGQGRMIPAALQAALARTSGPTIVCLQAGHGRVRSVSGADRHRASARCLGPRRRRVRVVGEGGGRAAASRRRCRARRFLGRGRAQVAQCSL